MRGTDGSGKEGSVRKNVEFWVEKKCRIVPVRSTSHIFFNLLSVHRIVDLISPGVSKALGKNREEKGRTAERVTGLTME